MLPQQIANKARKIIETNPDLYMIKNVYFNPKAANDLSQKVPELENIGIALFETETESEKGRVVTAQAKSLHGNILELGTIVLDGSTIITKGNLAPYSDLVDFIITNAFEKSDRS